MSKLLSFVKRQSVFVVALCASIIALFITPPTLERIISLDWHTLFTLFMLFLVLEGFKKENMFAPFFRLTGRFKNVMWLSYFLVGIVFFLAPFITNDVSLVTFVPLTILIFKELKMEEYTLKIVILENIAAITGAFLTPFGNPQNLFIYQNMGVSPFAFILHMLPLWTVGLLALLVAIRVVFKKKSSLEIKETIEIKTGDEGENKKKKIFYLVLFAVLLIEIITRVFNFVILTSVVLFSILIFDRKVFKKVDYFLLSTFFFFFLFSSSIGENGKISEILASSVKGYEYWWGLGVSQIISNVPGTALLFPFSENYNALLYGVNSAGMGTIVGSLASLITFSIYTKEYPLEKKRFLKYFHLFSLCFLVVLIVFALPIKNWQL